MLSFSLLSLLTCLLATAAPTVAKTKSTCAGSEGLGARACIDVTWSSSNQATVKTTVTDVKGDSHGVYADYDIYDGSWRNGKKVSNNNGYNKDPVSKTQDFYPVSGVRVKACVEDWGRNSCSDWAYVSA